MAVGRPKNRYVLNRANKEVEQYVERLGPALGRVGASSQSKLGWLLRLVESDLGAFRKGDWLNLDDDLQAFTFAEYGGYPRPPGLSQEEVISLKEQVRNFVLAIARGKSWDFELPDKHRVGRTSRGRVLHLTTGGLRSRVLLNTARLLEAEGHRLKKCLECKKLFISAKRQAYCSPSCSQKARTRRYFGSHSPQELSEKRHKALKRRIEKKRGRPTRVIRKKRHRI